MRGLGFHMDSTCTLAATAQQAVLSQAQRERDEALGALAELEAALAAVHTVVTPAFPLDRNQPAPHVNDRRLKRARTRARRVLGARPTRSL